MNEFVVRLNKVKKVFRDVPHGHFVALDNIDLEIEKGEFFIFLGPSGCGKSTLLRIMSNLEKDYEGKVELGEGTSYSDCSFVFQQFALLPWLTVFDNVEIGLIAKHLPRSTRKEIVNRELRRLKLEKFANSYPKELSGGMKQRVGIARALTVEPKIMFLDEPFSELDSFIAEELRQDLIEIWYEKKPTVIMVTHNIEETVELADRIAVMSTRPGKIAKLVVNKLPRPRIRRSDSFYKLEDELYGIIKV